MKRRSFVSVALAALGVPVPAQQRKSFLVVLTACEDGGGESWTGEGSSIRLAMASLRANLEAATCPFDEYFEEVFEESTVELERGARSARHSDFSLPESAYEITLVEKLEGGSIA